MLAYLDCFSGISGDMALGALIDLGVPLEWLRNQLGSLGVSGFTLGVARARRHGIAATRLDVQDQDGPPLRRLADIEALIEKSALPGAVKASSLTIFERIAHAESRIHGCPKGSVHFHEIGAVDTLVDVVGTCLGLTYLGIREIAASPVALGKGWIDTSHGRLPVPAPATLEILKGVPVRQTQIPFELTTPTGAALVACLSKGFGAMPEMTVERIGYGAGTRDHKAVPNVLRVVLGRRSAAAEHLEDRIVVVECAVDDMNPELFGHLMDRLFEDGALDVYWIPVHMKKNRPGTLIQVLCPQDRRDAVLTRILAERASIGVRYTEARRWILPREPVTVETAFGPVSAKRIRGLDGKWHITPEYEACRKIAAQQDISLQDVYRAVVRAGGGSRAPGDASPIP